jgi:hypothetical protein
MPNALDYLKSRKRTYTLVFLLGLLIFFWLAWRGVQPSYGHVVNFEWSQATGFKSVSINRPPLSPLRKALVTPMDAIVLLQAKPYIVSEVRKLGWTSARGRLGLATLGPFPAILGIDHLSLTNEYFIIDPEETPLMRAAEKGNVEEVMKLLAEGASVNAKDQSGYTALMYASKSFNDSAAVARALLSAEAEVNAKDRLGNTALNWATWNGIRLEVMNQLIAAGADVKARDASGDPVLLTAVSSGGDEQLAWKATKVLLSAGADTTARDSHGETALELAERIHRYSVVQLLKDWKKK